MSLICSSLPSGAHVTDFLGFPALFSPNEAGADRLVAADCPAPDELGSRPGGGVDVDAVTEEPAGDPYDLSSSSNGLIDDGCATFGSGSFFTGAGGAGVIFLKLGISFLVGFGFEKKDESDFAAGAALLLLLLLLLDGALSEGIPVLPGSFFTGTGLADELVPTALFLLGPKLFTTDAGSSLRFFCCFESGDMFILLIL